VEDRAPVTTAGVVIVAAILLAIVVGAVAVLRIDTFGERAGRDPNGLDQSSTKPERIDPALIHFRQTSKIPVGMPRVSAMAVGPDDRIYVAGKDAIHVFDSGGEKRAEVPLKGEPKCLAVGRAEHQFPGRIYIGMKDHVEVYDETGNRQATWEGLGSRAWLTSLAVADQDVFLADMGNRIVLRYDTSGNLLGRIGAKDPQRQISGFVITSPYFDLAVSPDKLLPVVNPRMLRIEMYTFDGDLELVWGEAASSVEGFFGCCNPVHLAVLPDGRFVTAEKGIPRVKVYGDGGEFQCVVAGPEQLATGGHNVLADVAVDSRGRILVLDAKAGGVLIFEEKQAHAGGEQ